jgi:predicted component of type VI protein secretion system
VAVTTTYDPNGGGRPRLVFAFGGSAPEGSEQREFDLLPGVTVIGSAPDADLQLDGLEGHHAEIRLGEGDEYVWVDLGTAAGSRVDGAPMGSQGLHTGDRIEIGDYTLTYAREEFADHGRPDGGREGGEFSGHPAQA